MISVIVPCRNEEKNLPVFLNCLIAQKLPRDQSLEVLIADGNSSDSSRKIILDFQQKYCNNHFNLILLSNPLLITPVALNIAIKMAKGEIIVRMDVHSEYAPDYIFESVRTLLRTGADNVGGPVRNNAVTSFQQAVALAHGSRFSTGGARSHDTNYRGYLDSVFCGCWYKSIFQKYGYFDEELVRNQDDEFNLRITLAGGKIYQEPRIQSWLYPRGSFSALFKQQKQYGYWKVRVIQKHKIPASLRHLVPGSYIVFLLSLTFFSIFSKFALGLLLAVVTLYSALNFGISVFVATRAHKPMLSLKIAAAFVAYHYGYGYGFLRGFIDFVCLKRKGREIFMQQTSNF